MSPWHSPILIVSGLSTNPCTLWICSSPDSGTIGPRILLPLLPRITNKRIELRCMKENFDLTIESRINKGILQMRMEVHLSTNVWSEGTSWIQLLAGTRFLFWLDLPTSRAKEIFSRREHTKPKKKRKRKKEKLQAQEPPLDRKWEAKGFWASLQLVATSCWYTIAKHPPLCFGPSGDSYWARDAKYCACA